MEVLERVQFGTRIILSIQDSEKMDEYVAMMEDPPIDNEARLQEMQKAPSRIFIPGTEQESFTTQMYL